MSKGKLSFLVTGFILLGLLAGIAIGCYLGYRYSAPLHSLRNFIAIAHYGEYAKLQYHNASYEDAKAALLHFIEFWDQLHGDEGSLFGENTYYFDTGLAYGRLALLEERYGNKGLMVTYLQRAQARLKSAGWRDFSEKKIREVLATIVKPVASKTSRPKIAE